MKPSEEWVPDLVGAKAKVLAEIDRRSDEAVELLRTLVRIPSVNPPGNEKAAADFCAGFLRDLGLEVRQVEPAPLRVSNVARLKGRTSRPVLLFNSHLDTFPPGDERNWKHPPYGAEIHDGILWGIGSKNMKAGLAGVMAAVRAIRACGVELSGDLLLSQTADEIVLGDLGLRYLVEQDLLHADYAVYTESDPPNKIEISHRGSMEIEISTRGLAKHTKLKGRVTPDGLVVNAIAKMTKVIDAIESMEFTGWLPDPYIPGPPVISTNMIRGGHQRGMSADFCAITVDCRYLPCQAPDGVMADIERVLDGLRALDPDLKVEASLKRVAHASEISPDEPIVKALRSAIKQVTGLDMPVGGVSSTSDARWLVLKAGIPTAKFEFQDSESGPNEHMAIADYLNTIRTYAVVILDLLY